jgi:post-GPI attachment to proteins factor 3
LSLKKWSVSHTLSDLPITEKLDYFSAALSILYGLYYSVVRLFHIYPPPRRRQALASSSNKTYKIWSASCLLIYLAHVSYLSILPRFDYTYNIVFNLILGLTHNILWLIYSLPASMPILRRFPFRSRSYRPAFASRAALLVALTMAATTFELFDFPPWGRKIDAHSLWHLSTAPLVILFYDFLIKDALDEGWKEER